MSEKHKFYQALSKAQGEFPAVKKNAKANAGKFVYGYVTLDAIIDAIREPMAKHGLGFFQEIQTEPTQGVKTIVFHESGESLETFCPFIGNYATMQQLGSCITYARRYGLQTAIGIFAEEDDDGQAATNHTARSQNSGNAPYSPPNQNRKPTQGGVSEKQIKRFWALARKAEVSKDQIDGMLQQWKLNSLTDISRQQYDAVCEKFKFLAESKDQIEQEPASEQQEQPPITTDDIPFE